MYILHASIHSKSVAQKGVTIVVFIIIKYNNNYYIVSICNSYNVNLVLRRKLRCRLIALKCYFKVLTPFNSVLHCKGNRT